MRLNEHLEHDCGLTVFQHACRMGLEGIVSKRLGSRYRSGRSPDWLKFKNPQAPAVTAGGGRGLGQMKLVRARYQISKNGISHNYCDRQDIAMQTARFLKSQES